MLKKTLIALLLLLIPGVAALAEPAVGTPLGEAPSVDGPSSDTSSEAESKDQATTDVIQALPMSSQPKAALGWCPGFHFCWDQCDAQSQQCYAGCGGNHACNFQCRQQNSACLDFCMELLLEC